MKKIFVSKLLAVVLGLFSIAAQGAADAFLTPVDGHKAAPEFDLAGVDGARYRLAELRGKAVIVNFWATWCPPCRAEMPSMQRGAEAVADDGVLFVAINVGESKDAVKGFSDRLGLTFPVLVDEASRAVQDWRARGLPTTYVVDPKGRLAYRAEGERDWDDPALLDQVRALVR